LRRFLWAPRVGRSCGGPACGLLGSYALVFLTAPTLDLFGLPQFFFDLLLFFGSPLLICLSAFFGVCRAALGLGLGGGMSLLFLQRSVSVVAGVVASMDCTLDVAPLQPSPLVPATMHEESVAFDGLALRHDSRPAS
jgi:hypothetical protein